MALSCTFNNLPAVRPVRPAPLSDEMYYSLMARGRLMYARWNTPARRPLVSDLWKNNRWVYHQDFQYRKEQVEKMLREAQKPQPERNPPSTFLVNDLHGWRKLAWYVIGFLDNVTHVWRIA